MGFQSFLLNLKSFGSSGSFAGSDPASTWKFPRTSTHKDLSCIPCSSPSCFARCIPFRCSFYLVPFLVPRSAMSHRLATQSVRSFISFNSCACSQSVLTKRALTTALNTHRRVSNRRELESPIRPKQVVRILSVCTSLRYGLNYSLACSEDFMLPHHITPQKTRMLFWV